MPDNILHNVFKYHLSLFTLLGAITLIQATRFSFPLSEFIQGALLLCSGLAAFYYHKYAFNTTITLHFTIIFGLIIKILLFTYAGNPGAPIQSLATLYLCVLSLFLGRKKTAVVLGVIYIGFMMLRNGLFKHSPDHFEILHQSPPTTFLYLLVILLSIFIFSVFIIENLEKEVHKHSANTTQIRAHNQLILKYETQITNSLRSLEFLSSTNSHDIRGPLSRVMTILDYWKVDKTTWQVEDYANFTIELQLATQLLEKNLSDLQSTASQELQILDHFE